MKLKQENPNKQKKNPLAIDQDEIINTWLDSHMTFAFWSTSLPGAAREQGGGPMQSCILHFNFLNDQKR